MNPLWNVWKGRSNNVWWPTTASRCSENNRVMVTDPSVWQISSTKWLHRTSKTVRVKIGEEKCQASTKQSCNRNQCYELWQILCTESKLRLHTIPMFHQSGNASVPNAVSIKHLQAWLSKDFPLKHTYLKAYSKHSCFACECLHQ
jgi:predicted double-glycine peptidase